MKKSFAAGMLFVLLILTIIGTAFAYTGVVTQELVYLDMSVTLNGDRLDLRDAQGNTVEPFTFDGTTYLPLRTIAEALGLNAEWDSTNKTAVLTTPETSRAIYITRTGQRYHYNNSCNGGTYWEVPLATALGFGLTPCDKCVHD